MRLALIWFVACAAPAPVATKAPAPPPRAKSTVPMWIGVFFEPGTARIGQVIPTSPAEKAGLREGDEIIAFDRQAVHSGKEVTSRVQGASGDIDLEIRRNAATQTIRVHLEPRPPIDGLATTLLDKPAPAIRLPKLGGGTFDLTEQHGHIVVVDFWATWCGPCLQQMPLLVDLQKRYPDVIVAGITSEDTATVEALHVPYLVVQDEDQVSWRKYFVTALPTTFVLDEKGIVRHVELGLGDPAAIEKVVVSLRSQPSP